ncbi:MAG: DEAD/DEAH box helicase [Thermodesulfobacteriota bacterium]
MKKLILFLKTLFTKKQQSKAPESSTLPQSPTKSKPQTAKKQPEKPKKKKWSVNDFKVEPKKGETRFHDFNLPKSVMHAVADLRFEYCTPIQAKLLAHTLEGKDATAKAQTGTGKSASFIITIITKFLKKAFKNKNGAPRALILAPTRELVHQIEKDFKSLAKYTNLRIIAVFGGTGYKKQQDMLKAKPVDIIVATPGRFIDFMNKRLINPSRVEIVVLDEADRMLDMGFIPDVRKIILKTPHKNQRQTLFFSATLTPEVLRLADSWTTDSKVQIEIEPEHAAADTINQIIYISTEKDKFKHVYNLINDEKLKRVLLFVNRKDTARRLSEQLERYGQKCSVLSGDVSQDRRFKVLDSFKNGRINILVATDVAARGLHIKNISHVINYDLPNEPEHYIHRIGRTGRAGAEGTSISFADEMSSFFIPKIEEVLGNKIECEYPSETLDKPLPEPKRKYQPKPKYKKRKPFKGKHKSKSYKQIKRE